jgi:hypothetical protein
MQIGFGISTRCRSNSEGFSPHLVLQNDVSNYKLAFFLISERLWRKMLLQSGQDLQRMNDTRNVTETGEQNVDQ